MNPRRRRHQRNRRKQLCWERYFALWAQRGTFSNLPSPEPLTLEKLLSAIEEVRRVAHGPMRFHPNPYRIIPPWLAKIPPI